MGADYSGNTRQSRVSNAELDYAQGRINYREMSNRVRAEGYTPSSAEEVKRLYANRRGRRR